MDTLEASASHVGISGEFDEDTKHDADRVAEVLNVQSAQLYLDPADPFVGDVNHAIVGNEVGTWPCLDLFTGTLGLRISGFPDRRDVNALHPGSWNNGYVFWEIISELDSVLDARSLSEKQCSKRYASLVECKDANYSTTKSRLL